MSTVGKEWGRFFWGVRIVKIPGSKALPESCKRVQPRGDDYEQYGEESYAGEGIE